MNGEFIRPSPRKRVEYVPSTKGLDWVQLGKEPERKPLLFTPIINIEGYIRSLDKTVDADRMRKLYTPKEEDTVTIAKTTYNVPSDPTTVFTTLKVLKNGTVRVSITAPMEPVYEYQKKGKMAPLPVRIKACKGFGYPDCVLEKMIIHDDYMKSISDSLDEFIENIFGQFTNSKVSKPKSKTIQESINTKLKKKPAKKY